MVYLLCFLLHKKRVAHYIVSHRFCFIGRIACLQRFYLHKDFFML